MDQDPISNLVHLYEDGALKRRDVIRRLAKLTGSVAAAMTVLESQGLGQVSASACPADVRVPETDRSIIGQDLTLYGNGSLFAYQVRPTDFAAGPRPAILVIHENQGLTPYIRDVTRRLAKAGYVAIAVDLLSRQGGTAQFSDATAAGAAYNRTVPSERREDMLSTLLTIRDQTYVRRDRLGVVGFCAGGGNVWDLALNTDILSAAVIYYGAPAPNPDQIPRLTAPLLGIYPELDRGTTTPLPQIVSALIASNKRYALHIYEGTNHAFHNDTGPRYDAAAACDAWAKTLAFFNSRLNAA